MNWFILGLILAGIGFAFSQIWVIILGLVISILDLVKIRPSSSPSPAPSGGTRLKHKLIQAPSELWEDELDFYTTFLATQGPPSLGIDILEPISKGAGEKLKPLEAGTLRKILPFSNYGESSAIQRMLAGFLVPVDNWLYPKTFEAKFKGKFGKEFKAKTFILGQEKEAEKLLKKEGEEKEKKSEKEEKNGKKKGKKDEKRKKKD